MIVRFLNILCSLLVTILAVFFTQKLNICQYVPFVPSNKAFEVCIAIYITAIGGLIDFSKDFISKYIENKKVNIKVICYTDSNNILLNNNPVITCNECGLSKIHIQVSLQGTVKKLKSSKIRFSSISQVEYQRDKSESAMKLDANGDMVIVLDEMCGNQKEVKLTETFILNIIRNVPGAKCELEPLLENKKILMKFEKNNVTVNTGGN